MDNLLNYLTNITQALALLAPIFTIFTIFHYKKYTKNLNAYKKAKLNFLEMSQFLYLYVFLFVLAINSANNENFSVKFFFYLIFTAIILKHLSLFVSRHFIKKYESKQNKNYIFQRPEFDKLKEKLIEVKRKISEEQYDKELKDFNQKNPLEKLHIGSLSAFSSGFWISRGDFYINSSDGNCSISDKEHKIKTSFQNKPKDLLLSIHLFKLNDKLESEYLIETKEVFHKEMKDKEYDFLNDEINQTIKTLSSFVEQLERKQGKEDLNVSEALVLMQKKKKDKELEQIKESLLNNLEIYKEVMQLLELKERADNTQVNEGK